MDALLAPIMLFGANSIPTSILEIAATVLTIVCVILAARNRLESYPVGILGVIAFFFVFWSADLYASAILQLYFIPVQIYGWWFWARGRLLTTGARTAPPIRDWPWNVVGLWALAAAIVTLFIAHVLKTFMPTQVLPQADVAILAFSVLAQFLMDRRVKKSWIVWLVVNTISIPLYASQGLYLAAITYGVLWVNAFHGYLNWNAIQKRQSAE